jgi:ubiquitin-small subunit ribosomal protein S27Ae
MADKKAEVKKKPAAKVANVYQVSGDSIKSKNKTCPKCGVFMANHKNRDTCGTCGYMEKK